MIDPLAEVVATLRAQMEAEKAQAQHGSRFADEARWTASNETIEAMLLEHFATTQDPNNQRTWILLSILMEHDESRTMENSDDVLFSGKTFTNADAVAAWRALVASAADQVAARATMYTTVIIERAEVGDDGQTFDVDLAWQIGLQLDTAAEMLNVQRTSARVN